MRDTVYLETSDTAAQLQIPDPNTAIDRNTTLRAPDAELLLVRVSVASILCYNLMQHKLAAAAPCSETR